MASADVSVPEDWLVNNFFDWGLVSRPSNPLSMFLFYVM